MRFILKDLARPCGPAGFFADGADEVEHAALIRRFAQQKRLQIPPAFAQKRLIHAGTFAPFR